MDKEEEHCNDNDPADRHQGNNWDYVAYDPEHRLVISVKPGKRERFVYETETIDSCREHLRWSQA